MNKIFNLKIKNIKVFDIYNADYPDYSDAFIGYAEHEDGTPLTDEEIDEVNEDRDFVYEKIMESIT